MILSDEKVIPTQIFFCSSHKDTALTALEGDGQQCKAAPAWTASTEPDAKGSLETSALTRAILLQTTNETLLSTSESKIEKQWTFYSLAALNSK